MDGLIDELLRLESAKHQALIEIDASAYETHVQEQLRLLASRKSTVTADVKRLLTLSQLITLNTRLLQNLVSTCPLFVFSKNGYTANGHINIPAAGRVSVEG
jgi:hypothetical protein